MLLIILCLFFAFLLPFCPPASVNAGCVCGTANTPNYAVSMSWARYCYGIAHNNNLTMAQKQNQCNEPVQFCEWNDQSRSCSAVRQENFPDPSREQFSRWREVCRSKGNAGHCGKVVWNICFWDDNTCNFSESAYEGNPYGI